MRQRLQCASLRDCRAEKLSRWTPESAILCLPPSLTLPPQAGVSGPQQTKTPPSRSRIAPTLRGKRGTGQRSPPVNAFSLSSTSSPVVQRRKQLASLILPSPATLSISIQPDPTFFLVSVISLPSIVASSTPANEFTSFRQSRRLVIHASSRAGSVIGLAGNAADALPTTTNVPVRITGSSSMPRLASTCLVPSQRMKSGQKQPR